MSNPLPSRPVHSSFLDRLAYATVFVVNHPGQRRRLEEAHAHLAACLLAGDIPGAEALYRHTNWGTSHRWETHLRKLWQLATTHALPASAKQWLGEQIPFACCTGLERFSSATSPAAVDAYLAKVSLFNHDLLPLLAESSLFPYSWDIVKAAMSNPVFSPAEEELWNTCRYNESPFILADSTASWASTLATAIEHANYPGIAWLLGNYLFFHQHPPGEPHDPAGDFPDLVARGKSLLARHALAEALPPATVCPSSSHLRQPSRL